jgi:hypothetical protein
VVDVTAIDVRNVDAGYLAKIAVDTEIGVAGNCKITTKQMTTIAQKAESDQKMKRLACALQQHAHGQR